MTDNGRVGIDFGKDGIWALFRAMFFPTLVGMIFNSALTIIDGVFVGQGVGADGIAAVNIVAPLFLVTTGIGLLFGIGSSVVTSIHLAKKNIKAARTVMTQATVVGFVLMSAIIAASLCFTNPILGMLGCSPRLEAHATDYLLWLLPGLFFLYMQCVGMMLIRLDGSPRYAMWVQIVARHPTGRDPDPGNSNRGLPAHPQKALTGQSMCSRVLKQATVAASPVYFPLSSLSLQVWQ